MSRITFLKVSTNQEKLVTLTKIVERHFDMGHKVLVFTPNAQVATYMDQLLWRLPEESFIPHKIANETCHDAIVITNSHENLNQAGVLINLCPSCHPSYHDFNTVYELYDQTHPEKEALSKQRQAHYSESNSKISMQEALN